MTQYDLHKHYHINHTNIRAPGNKYTLKEIAKITKLLLAEINHLKEKQNLSRNKLFKRKTKSFAYMS